MRDSLQEPFLLEDIMATVTLVAISVALLILVSLVVAFWRVRRKKRKRLVFRAVQEQGPKALPSDILAHVNQNADTAIHQGELIRLLDQLVEDKLVQKHELSSFDRARLARKSLKGVCSRTSGVPIKVMGIMARFSLTQEGHQQAA